MSAHLEADVIVIGSGVAGSLIAWRLAEAKFKVLILEAGPRIDRTEALKLFLAASDKNINPHFRHSPRHGLLTTTSTPARTSFVAHICAASAGRLGIGRARSCATGQAIFE